MNGTLRLLLLVLLSSLLCWHPVSAKETGGLLVSVPEGSNEVVSNGSNEVPRGSSEVPRGSNEVPRGSNEVPRGSNEVPRGSNGDSIRTIDEVTVRSRIRHHETIEPLVLKGAELERMNAHNVADALRFASGVTMKDYGGLGGLKTVNLRSMGSEHVGIYYDGIELGNAQNGVIDLGQLSLDNIEEVGLYQGQRSAILQSASDFAHAGSVYIRTRRTAGLSADHPQQARARLQAGAAGLVRLSGLYERRLSDQVGLSLNIEGLSANGKYDFRYRRINLDGSVAYDTTATRQNGDIQAIRAEMNLLGHLSNNGYWEAKAYTYHSNRGIPGAIVNNVWRRGERQSDDNSWLQGTYQRDFSDRYTLKVLAKYARYRTHYVNRDTTQLMVDNIFSQQEAYLSMIQVAELLPWWSLSLSLDERWNHLDADVARFAHPTRWSSLASLAMAMDLHRLQLQASLVGSYIHDYNALTDSKAIHRNWAPALFASLQIASNLKVTGFAKRSFRMPTMNDLFYTDMGNALLEPEVALQYDLGLEWSSKRHETSAAELSSKIQETSDTEANYQCSIHLYHNAVHDKIVAYPKGQQFRWTMLNLGRVHIDGIDINASAHWPIGQQMAISGRVSYTYQRARDVTDRATSYYGDQIPYTPWHNGSATLTLNCREWDLALNQVYTGERYCQQENLQYNHLQPWYTTDAHLSYRHTLGRYRCKATLELNNLWDQQYDVIINYPMPGRNLNVTLQCEF